VKKIGRRAELSFEFVSAGDYSSQYLINLERIVMTKSAKPSKKSTPTRKTNRHTTKLVKETMATAEQDIAARLAKAAAIKASAVEPDPKVKKTPPKELLEGKSKPKAKVIKGVAPETLKQALAEAGTKGKPEVKAAIKEAVAAKAKAKIVNAGDPVTAAVKASVAAAIAAGRKADVGDGPWKLTDLAIKVGNPEGLRLRAGSNRHKLMTEFFKQGAKAKLSREDVAKIIGADQVGQVMQGMIRYGFLK
jgi:hypothetical protein